MEANRANTLATIADYYRAVELTDQSIANSTAAKSDLQQFIEQNFGQPILYADTNTNEKVLELEGTPKRIVDYWKT